jgi:polar amino acid transport system substrate-binding protein
MPKPFIIFAAFLLLIAAIAGEIGVSPRLVTTAWDGIIAGLLAGRYDLICGSMAITEKRLKSIDFSEPYYRSGAQLFVGRNANPDSAKQLRGMAVGGDSRHNL